MPNTIILFAMNRKKNLCLLIAFVCLLQVGAQKTQTPDVLWGKLFEEVQLKRIFPDNKTFVDAVPKMAPDVILAKYNSLKAKDTAFDLKAFVTEHFTMPQVPVVKVEGGLTLEQHLNGL